jgi:hypothetical protein
MRTTKWSNSKKTQNRTTEKKRTERSQTTTKTNNQKHLGELSSVARLRRRRRCRAAADRFGDHRTAAAGRRRHRAAFCCVRDRPTIPAKCQQNAGDHSSDGTNGRTFRDDGAERGRRSNFGRRCSLATRERIDYTIAPIRTNAHQIERRRRNGSWIVDVSIEKKTHQ